MRRKGPAVRELFALVPMLPTCWGHAPPAQRQDDPMIKVSVLYPAAEGARFDMDYYVHATSR